MRRPDYSDIPEAFRRAFEEGEDGNRPPNSGGGPGRGGGGGNGGGSGSGPQPWWANRRVWLIGLAFVLFLSFNWLITTYIDWLWFMERGYDAVWIKQLTFRAATFAVFFVIALLIFQLSWQTARRSAATLTVAAVPGPTFFNQQLVRIAINLVSPILAFTFASAAAAQWESILLYFNQVSFGKIDPLFSRDISFYVFSLPVFRQIQGWFMPLIVFSIIGVMTIYLLKILPTLQASAVQRPGQRFQLSDVPAPIRRHIGILGAIFFGLWAWGYWLQTFELVFSARGVVFGASYTDVNASLYALYAQMAAAIIFAATLLLNAYRLEIRPLAIGFGLWIFATILVGGAYPLILQRFVVVPNEIAVEREFIEYNIDFTRAAFGLDNIVSQQFGAVDVLEEQDLIDNSEALQNVRLWDYRPLLQTYSQLQELRPYYQFTDVDIDRYQINGETRQVMLSPRELDKDNLPSSTWINERLVFTHGYGIVMNPVDRFTTQGRPEFFISDIPPQSTVGIEVAQPEIYYGLATNDVVFVGSDQPEFSFAGEDGDVYTTYSGTGGVEIGGFFRKLAFVARFGESNLLFSDAITPTTRAMFYRNIQQRVQTITPFLLLDNDPYVVISEGRLIWIQDAYTVSDNYPYSQPVRFGSRELNYIRNSVKITIDAYTGEVTYYANDRVEDPIIDAYTKAFPTLFRPLSEFPETLTPHLRYPEDLFDIQAFQYLTYHMTDAQIFYNKEDLWEIPQEIFEGSAQQMEPYYVSFRLPGEAETEYLLIQPYTPAGKRNMIAWMAARNDPEHLGELVSYEFPKQSLVVGPFQIEGFIDQEPEISQQFSLWDQRGSSIIRGNLIVIPLNDSFLYVEPIYLESETSALPELKRVIVASGEGIVMRETLDEALEALLDEEVQPIAELETGDETEAISEESESTSSESTSSEPPAVSDVDIDSASIDELIQLANEQFEAAEQAQRDGNWSEYGAQIEALAETLAQLEQLTGGLDN